MKTIKELINETAGVEHVIGFFLDSSECDGAWDDFYDELKDLLEEDGLKEGDDYEIEDDNSCDNSYDYDEENGEYMTYAVYLRFSSSAVTEEIFVSNPRYKEYEVMDCTEDYE